MANAPSNEQIQQIQFIPFSQIDFSPALNFMRHESMRVSDGKKVESPQDGEAAGLVGLITSIDAGRVTPKEAATGYQPCEGQRTAIEVSPPESGKVSKKPFVCTDGFGRGEAIRVLGDAAKIPHDKLLVKCIVKVSTEHERVKTGLVQNIAREDMTPGDTIYAVAKYLETMGEEERKKFTGAALAGLCAISVPHAYRILDLAARVGKTGKDKGLTAEVLETWRTLPGSAKKGTGIGFREMGPIAAMPESDQKKAFTELRKAKDSGEEGTGAGGGGASASGLEKAKKRLEALALEVAYLAHGKVVKIDTGWIDAFDFSRFLKAPTANEHNSMRKAFAKFLEKAAESIKEEERQERERVAKNDAEMAASAKKKAKKAGKTAANGSAHA